MIINFLKFDDDSLILAQKQIQNAKGVSIDLFIHSSGGHFTKVYDFIDDILKYKNTYPFITIKAHIPVAAHGSAFLLVLIADEYYADENAKFGSFGAIIHTDYDVIFTPMVINNILPYASNPFLEYGLIGFRNIIAEYNLRAINYLKKYKLSLIEQHLMYSYFNYSKNDLAVLGIHSSGPLKYEIKESISGLIRAMG